MSGQWVPSPRPVSFPWFRSFCVAWRRRGYHARGTRNLRPSTRSTVSVTLVTETCAAAHGVNSEVEESVPCIDALLLVCGDKVVASVDLVAVKPSTVLQDNGFQPEFGDAVIPFHMNMAGFVTITGVETKRYEPWRNTVGISIPVCLSRFHATGLTCILWRGQMTVNRSRRISSADRAPWQVGMPSTGCPSHPAGDGVGDPWVFGFVNRTGSWKRECFTGNIQGETWQVRYGQSGGRII